MEPIVVTDTPERTISIKVASDELVVTETRYTAGQRGPALHVHHLHTDCFYVLEGALTLALEDGERTLTPGAFALVPPNVVHSFRNAGPGELRFVNLHAPGMGFDRYLQDLYDEALAAPFDQHSPPDGGGRDPSLVIAGAGELVAERPSLTITLLADAPEVGVSFSRSVPDGPSPLSHLHPRHTESFGVLEGEMTFEMDGYEIQAGAGAWVHVPLGTVHTFSFRGSDDVSFLDVHAPSCGFGDFLRALHAARTDDELRAARELFDQAPAPS